MSSDANAIFEITPDGSFDLSNPEAHRDKNDQHSVQIDEMQSIRLQGKEAFAMKNYELALELFNRMILVDPSDHTLYGNRSAAYLHLNQPEKAVKDADQAISLCSTWAKGYYRKASAFASLKRFSEAEENYRLAAKFSPEMKSLNSCANRMRLLAAKEKKMKEKQTKSATATAKGFFNKSKTSIYDDCDEIIVDEIDEHGISKSSRLLLRKLCASITKKKDEETLDGVFKKLMDKDEFKKIIYPGVPKEKLLHLPKSFSELLNDPWYKDELSQLMPNVEAKASLVLSNVKAKAAVQGEFMDEKTEIQLRPQVLKEAFGREVVSMVHRVNSIKHSHLVRSMDCCADTDTECASWNQLSVDTVNGVCSKKGYVFQDNFMGIEWVALLRQDVERMKKNGLLESVSNVLSACETTSKIRYLEKQDCDPCYPALLELLEKLHALPHELNLKTKIGLNKAALFSTLLKSLEHGQSQLLCKDGGRGNFDNGHAISCIYFLNPNWKKENGGMLKLQNNENSTEIEPIADRIVFYRSRDVCSQINTVHSYSFYSIGFWMYGPDKLMVSNSACGL